MAFRPRQRRAVPHRSRQALTDFFGQSLVEAELRVGWDQQSMRGEIFESCTVVEEKSDELGTLFRVRAAPATIERLKSRLTSPAPPTPG